MCKGGKDYTGSGSIRWRNLISATILRNPYCMNRCGLSAAGKAPFSAVQHRNSGRKIIVKLPGIKQQTAAANVALVRTADGRHSSDASAKSRYTHIKCKNTARRQNGFLPNFDRSPLKSPSRIIIRRLTRNTCFTTLYCISNLHKSQSPKVDYCLINRIFC